MLWQESHNLLRIPIVGNNLARGNWTGMKNRKLPLPARDFNPVVSTYVCSEWQREWDAQRRNKLRELKPALKPWSSSLRTNRQEEVVLCRLRIGHTYATHSYLLRGEEKPMCPRCLVPLTVCHILLACPNFSSNRARHLGRIAPHATLRHLLGEDSAWVQTGALFSYILDIKFPVIYSSR